MNCSFWVFKWAGTSVPGILLPCFCLQHISDFLCSSANSCLRLTAVIQPHISLLMAEEVSWRKQNQKAIYISLSLLCLSLILYNLQNSYQPAMSFVAAMAASWPGMAHSASAQMVSRWVRTAAAAEVGLSPGLNERLCGIYKFVTNWRKNQWLCYTMGAFCWNGLCSLVFTLMTLQINT